MSRSKSRRFRREFKLLALSRMDAGENVSALSRELKVRRKLLYEWRDAFRAGGEAALRPPGRPRKGTPVVGSKGQGWSLPRASGPRGSASSPGDRADELAAARQRIAALERKVGQQALEADFLEQALQLLETCRRPRVRTGAGAPSASSGPGRSGKAD